MRRLYFVCLTLVLLVLLSACSPAAEIDSASPATGIPPAASVSGTPNADMPNADMPNADMPDADISDELVQRLKSFLGQETGIRTGAIALQKTESVEWSDACLGVSNPEEFCAEVITLGYRAVLDTPEGEYIVHTDQAGRVFRIAQTP